MLFAAHTDGIFSMGGVFLKKGIHRVLILAMVLASFQLGTILAGGLQQEPKQNVMSLQDSLLSIKDVGASAEYIRTRYPQLEELAELAWESVKNMLIRE